MTQFLIGVIIFILTFALIVSEKIPDTLSALLGGFLMIAVGIISEEKAFESIDMEVIFLLIGMMIIVHIMSETGVFQWVAIRLAQFVRGEPFLLLILLMLATALFSAFLDNVTTIMLIVPVSIILTEQLKLDPIPFLLMEVFASNIGGAATLIGDPPNILIATAGEISFNEFMFNMGPLVLIDMLFLIIISWFLFGRKMKVSRDLKARIMEIDPNRALRDNKILMKSGIVMGLVILGFLTNSITNFGIAATAMSGAVVLMIIAKQDPEEIFKTVEWKTLFFFIGLFILVQGVVEIGVLKILGQKMIKVTHGNLKITSALILWISTFVSAIVNNIPYTTTIIPLIKNELIPNIMKLHPELTKKTIEYALWWALSVGACFGGNATIVGASANVVATGIAAKSGRKISFFEFLKYGVLITILTVIVSNIYIYWRYL
ncbi:putative tyrosine transporter P-protein [Hypnocyclicus thermotrophus]|uniref:Tyrosine transporter P-protein n=1 Tax=Hypnocyclicus thermotrophus TaxID=1627895 RepID=A0AA46DYI3_9FUSO|nr:ArsB/NhaD family transporter [Hypnocyclicus thermotrophus]TDT69727.1 putative tyrosine transporter P-protein [Hypnocyclicus thermotrophus]